MIFKVSLLTLFFLLSLSSCATKKFCSNSKYANRSTNDLIRYAEKRIKLPGKKKAVSFVLYGDIKLYTQGTIENMRVAKTIYPGWDLLVTVDKSVPKDIVAQLEQLEAIVIHEEKVDAASRFFPFDLDYDVMVFRDADSRSGIREMVAVVAFLDSEFVLHGMRDAVSNERPLLAGLWAAKIPAAKKLLKGQTLRALYNEFIEKTYPDGNKVWGYDEFFLRDILFYKHITPERVLIHDSFRCGEFPNSVGFPLSRGQSATWIGQKRAPKT